MRARTSTIGLKAAWLAQVVEETLEPGRPIVDPHHHFWRRAYASYAFCPHYLLPELWEDTGSCGAG